VDDLFLFQVFDSGLSGQNFYDREIASLIAERGERLSFCNYQERRNGDLVDFGIVAQIEAVCQPIIGYTIPESVTEIAAGYKSRISTGNRMCYVIPATLQHEQILSTSRIICENRPWQIQVVNIALDRGTDRLHHLRLIPTIEPTDINSAQPDNLIDIIQ
jgi:hypothetical protein